MQMARRPAVALAAFLAIAILPVGGIAQRTGARNPVFLAVTFKAPAGDARLGVEVAEAIRQRMLRTFPFPPRPGQLRVVKQEEINLQLSTSGFPPDTALGPTDVQLLGRGIGADESMDGSVRRTAAGVEARARVYVLSNIGAPEVLPVVVEKDAAAAGRKIAEIYIQARKELPEYEKCRNALIQNQPEQAVVAAKAAQTIYDKGVLPRACLLTAYGKLVEQKKMPLDSVMRVANEIVAVDPENEIALYQLADAHRALGDTAKAIETMVRIAALRPADVATVKPIIEGLPSFGAPEKALAIVEEALRSNPGEVDLIEQQWKLYQTTGQWKRAIAVGEEMVRIDSSKADTAFFNRQIGAAYRDSQPQLVLQYLDRATRKFPRDVRLLQAYSQELRKQGQVQEALAAAQKIIAADPRSSLGYATVVTLYVQLGKGDSAVTFARRALAADPDTALRKSIGQGLLSMVGPALSKAQADSTASADAQRANWTQVYTLSAAVDSIVPQSHTAFYMSLSAFFLAQNAINRLQSLQRDRAAACAELKTAADMILVVDLNMARGGPAEPRTAANILTALSGTVKPYVADMRTRFTCR